MAVGLSAGSFYGGAVGVDTTRGSDREHWNDRYRHADPPTDVRPPEVLAAYEHLIPHEGRALDVAGGTGDAALTMAARGLDTTLVDVSDVALDIVKDRAQRLGMTVSTERCDLTANCLPTGPWDAISCVHYLDRELLPQLGDELTHDGVLLVGIATKTNLERHARPSERFLLEADELPSLVPQLDVIDHVEQWTPSGVHEAWLAARRSATRQ
ncbi:MAG: class I SAM-dependent methyltransferase [Acidimicrobiales bacterium]